MKHFKKTKLNLLKEKNKLMRVNNENKKTLIEVQNLKTYFPVVGGIFRKVIGYVKAVDGCFADCLSIGLDSCCLEYRWFV